ncbi:flagellar assembly peptidoglycan hydrolase FlgJ [Nitrobacter sp. 62-13]|jgi:Rod binding domain-containing protein|uniref:flagellar assembly peptidoglycan hydrolase FlgJ n=1 Tax=Nitrobacter sp. 62-13 TaxID=1895797 RepID=UPI0025FA1370|nr:flagellar assembly peptidoglycan hydrolase FlgJ [Nitrobacter sp. 62-13]
MQLQIDSSLIASAYRSIPRKAMMPMLNGRPDPQLQQALEKVSPQAIQKATTTSQDFEAMFLNSMFSQMTSGLKGEGPFGDTPGTGVWRSMLTEQYSKSFAKAGGVGVSDAVFRALIMQQASEAKPAPKEAA